ncbi:hypothetical protein AX15_001710 [Amanita polypyramis BW_CC]|nr:hypothetical protein AX15_001710 [Amanita polypyramis BW_CC]
MSPYSMREGTVSFDYAGETYQTYFKLYGTPTTTATRAPLVVLHGGPGLVHDYLLPLASLSANHNIPVIFYDQLGNGRSSHCRPRNEPPSSPHPFWSIDLFVNELDNLVHKLGIQDKFDLLGHSWGGVLAAEYEVRKQPAGLRKMVLSNSLASQQLWNRSNAELAKKFSLSVREGLKVGSKDMPRFWAALEEYYAAHGCIVDSGRELFMKAIWEAIGPDGDPTVSNVS